MNVLMWTKEDNDAMRLSMSQPHWPAVPSQHGDVSCCFISLFPMDNADICWAQISILIIF